ncbi:hypothetical protein BDY21DRAFT_348942 [Lineolata rhizophorae]|uniref:Uncharacterized protein n=1 Tax=Lineolata rhizophorae TaxID=578093 RepID=A0A6A6NVS1_9PEZI|nr:hypothetical protein BDY21DRAFT_348942 [Lineolata rhizophorae]
MGRGVTHLMVLRLLASEPEICFSGRHVKGKRKMTRKRNNPAQMECRGPRPGMPRAGEREGEYRRSEWLCAYPGRKTMRV